MAAPPDPRDQEIARLQRAASVMLEALKEALPHMEDEFGGFEPRAPETRALNAMRQAIALAEPAIQRNVTEGVG